MILGHVVCLSANQTETVINKKQILSRPVFFTLDGVPVCVIFLLNKYKIEPKKEAKKFP